MVRADGRQAGTGRPSSLTPSPLNGLQLALPSPLNGLAVVRSNYIPSPLNGLIDQPTVYLQPATPLRGQPDFAPAPNLTRTGEPR